MTFDQSYRYLDSEADRQALIAEMQSVRQAVIDMTETVPEAQWYEPRYHGWSLAAMLGHLQLMDNAHMLLIQLALVGVRFPLSMTVVDRFNDTVSGIFRQRVLKTTISGIQKKQDILTDFINNLPIDKFTTQVYYPPMRKYLTVEQAIQVLFLHHWQDHLQTMLDVEGLQYQPPGSDATGSSN
jgi:hypothetical protein